MTCTASAGQSVKALTGPADQDRQSFAVAVAHAGGVAGHADFDGAAEAVPGVGMGLLTGGDRGRADGHRRALLLRAVAVSVLMFHSFDRGGIASLRQGPLLDLSAASPNDRPSISLDRPSMSGSTSPARSKAGAGARPAAVADALSDVLKTVRMTGAIFYGASGVPPWVTELPSQERILARILPGAEHLVAYHVITEGRCFANIVGGEPILVEAGEVVVMAHGDGHVLSSAPGMRLEPGGVDVLEAVGNEGLPFFVGVPGGGPPSAKFICGFLGCDAQPFNPLLQALPRLIKVGNPRDRESGWLGQFVRFVTLEADEKACGKRQLPRQAQRADVHRGGAALHRGPA